ncbi:MAG: D-tyrosyl-tRNA(Tyr) deacylase [Planctomycetaceae bacterium]|nr:D-tyrosyl-tRNA(Tyr) deacylase [Planctomycetaceae bacterium]
MRSVAQRVRSASVRVDDRVVGEIGPGLLVLLGVAEGDGEPNARWMARKLANLRIFPDDQGRMNRSVVDTGGSILLVSQFTLCADTRQGNRPSFVNAAQPEVAEPLVTLTEALLRGQGLTVATGTFGASMLVSLENDGPVTIVLNDGSTH